MKYKSFFSVVVKGGRDWPEEKKLLNLFYMYICMILGYFFFCNVKKNEEFSQDIEWFGVILLANA